MIEEKEHLTALAIKTTSANQPGGGSSGLAMDILKIVEDRLVGQVEEADFKAAENAIYKRLKQEVEGAK